MKILIVDDEELALSRLKRLLNNENIEHVTTINNAKDAIFEVTKNKFDIAFLDISMPLMSGLELANAILAIDSSVFIVFQTAHEEYALDAYECGGIDYLIKPIEPSQIKRVLNRIEKLTSSKQLENKKLIGKRGNKLYIINIEDIYYIKADLDEVIVKIKNADVTVKRKIGDLEQLLQNKQFFRIHRSIIINIDKVKSMQSVEQSKLLISFNEIDDVVTSSKDGAKEFREYLDNKSL